MGQLENSSQISKVRHDIARIMTVLREREFGIVAQVSQDAITLGHVAVEPEKPVEPAEEAKPKRGRAAKPKAEKDS